MGVAFDDRIINPKKMGHTSLLTESCIISLIPLIVFGVENNIFAEFTPLFEFRQNYALDH